VQYLESKLGSSNKNCRLADNGQNNFDATQKKKTHWHLEEQGGNGPMSFFPCLKGKSKVPNRSCQSTSSWVEKGAISTPKTKWDM